MKKLRADLIRFIKVKFYNLPEIESEAEDIVNQTFLKVCIKNYAELNFSLLSTIAKNEAINRFNEQKKNICLEQMENTLFDDDNNFNNLEAEENYLALAQAREKLKHTENQIIHLYYYEELNFIEISKRTGINLNTILSHHRRALFKMKKSITNSNTLNEIDIN